MLTQTNNQETFKFVGFLSEALPAVNYSIPTEINEGGCGVFASLLYRALSDLGYSPKIFALFYNLEGIEGRTRYFKTGQNPEKSGEDHIVVELDGMALDSTGLVTAQRYRAKLAVEINSDQLDMIVAVGRWNPVFDRGQTPLIQEYLTQFFSQWKDGQYIPGTLITKCPESLRLSEATIREKKKQMSFNSIFGGY